MSKTMSFEMWLQSRLTAHGFSPGPIDGEIGDLTTRAMLAFQKDHHLRQTGTATDETVAALREPASTVAAPDKAPLPDRTIAAPAPVKTLWPTQSGVSRFYGAVGTNQVLVALPFPMRLAWDKSVTINRISLHAKVAESAARCLERIADAYTPARRADLGLDLFGGSLNVRRMRGGSTYSMHAWGIAIDFDPERNQLKWGRDRARLARPDAETLWKIWEDEGWVSLGRARNYDWMHVQAARL